MSPQRTLTSTGDETTVAIDNGDGTGATWVLHGEQLGRHAAMFDADIAAAAPADKANANKQKGKFK